MGRASVRQVQSVCWKIGRYGNADCQGGGDVQKEDAL